MFLSKMKFVPIVVLAAGFAGSGLGFLAHRTNASPPSTPSPPPANLLHARVGAPALANAKANAPAQPNPNPPVQLIAHRMRDKLRQEVNYEGLEDARATLADALDQISKRYDLNFHANREVFRAIDPKIDVWRFEIADPNPLPAMRVSLGTVLRTILDRLPPKMGALYVIRKEFIEITTEAAVRAELHIPANRPLLPLVLENLEDIPITAALRLLADNTGYNVVVDPRVAEKLRTSTNLVEFKNVPLDTAVRLLANMAGMSMVRLDNVLYVTTADNARKLRDEQAQVNADAPAKSAEPQKKSEDKKPVK